MDAGDGRSGPLTAPPSRGTVTAMQGNAAAAQLALWIGRKGQGRARLRWNGGELAVHVDSLQIVGVEGDDGDMLSTAFGLTSGGEWFAEAHAAVAAGQVSEGEANAVVKRALASRLRSFFLAPDGEVSFEGGGTEQQGELTISYPHLVVEMVLSQGGEDLVPVFIPDTDLILRRLPDFPRRVGALQLTEEAMAVLAKINDARSAREIAEPSPHGEGMVLRLVAATVASGLVETAQRIVTVPLVSRQVEVDAVPAARGRRWPWLLLLLAALAVIVVLALTQPWARANVAGRGGPWAVAVDGGCQPSEMERLYRQQDRNPQEYQVVPFGTGSEHCYRLVWGHFATEQSAQAAMQHLPAGTLARGFAPHVVRVDTAGAK